MAKLHSIKQIQNHDFIGNAYHDGNVFMEISNFAADLSNTIADRAEALRVMSDKGMGCGRDEHISDKDIVVQHMAEFE